MNLHQSNPASAAIPLVRQSAWSPTFRPARAPGRSMTDSYLRLLTWTSIAYIVASQGLVYFSGWSRLGVLCAIFLAFLLAAGWICRLADFPHAGWVWFPLAFVVYALVRAIPDHGHPWPTDVLLKLPSAFLGGVGIGLALQAGVPFRALALAQTLIFIGNVVAVSAGVGSEPPAEVDLGRQSGLTGNANELAMQLTLGACMVWLAPKKSGRSLLLLAFAALIYGILTTGSRKSLIVAVCFLVLVAIQTRGFWRTRHLRVVLILAAPLVLFALLLAIPLLQESRHIVAVKRTLDYRDSSFNLRVEMARQAFRLWHEAPLVGWGTDSFREISGFEKYAHSNYAELLCDLGVIGCCLFYALHVYILFKCLRLPRPWGIACALFVLMLAAVDAGLVSYTRKQTIMLLMILAAAVSAPNILLAPTGQALRRIRTARKC